MQFLVFLLGFLVSSLCFAAEIPVEDGVLVLGADNFDAAIKEHKNILIEFYAPWCGHCKALAPEYAKAAQALADSPVKLAKVDATVHRELGSQYGVKGFPTLKFFKNGKVSDYSGGRTEKDILRWLEKKTGPTTTTLATVEELEKFQSAHDVFALGVFESTDSSAATAFLTAADSDEFRTYAFSTDAGIRKKLDITTGDAVIVLKAFDDERVDLSVPGGLSAEAINEFVNKVSTPWVQEFSQETSKAIFSSPIKQHVLFFTDKESTHHNEVIASYREVAKSFQGEFLFVNVPSSEEKVLQFFDITASDVPATVLANLADTGILKYPFPKTTPHTFEAITTFINSYKSGKLQPHLNSEEVSPQDKEGDVVVVKGKSFQEIVLDSPQDVLIEFYAPWCGHCKQLAPTWDALGKSLKEKKDKIIIAKMDATANEVNVPGMSVRGFPTIYFFPAGDKGHPIKYEEKRELDDFLYFLEKNGHPELGVVLDDDHEEDGFGGDEL